MNEKQIRVEVSVQCRYYDSGIHVFDQLWGMAFKEAAWVYGCMCGQTIISAKELPRRIA